MTKRRFCSKSRRLPKNYLAFMKCFAVLQNVQVRISHQCCNPVVLCGKFSSARGSPFLAENVQNDVIGMCLAP